MKMWVVGWGGGGGRSGLQTWLIPKADICLMFFVCSETSLSTIGSCVHSFLCWSGDRYWAGSPVRDAPWPGLYLPLTSRLQVSLNTNRLSKPSTKDNDFSSDAIFWTPRFSLQNHFHLLYPKWYLSHPRGTSHIVMPLFSRPIFNFLVNATNFSFLSRLRVKFSSSSLCFTFACFCLPAFYIDRNPPEGVGYFHICTMYMHI
jgi:hypothetical protein